MRGKLCTLGYAALLLCTSACELPLPFSEQLLFSTDRAQLPEARDCERCHSEVYQEWAESPHAQAWTAESFVAFTGERQAEACLGCHAPAPLGEEGRAVLRADHRDEGVTCTSCHLSSDPHAAPLTMRGPWKRSSPLNVHPIVQDPLFTRAELCGSCHAGVLEQWKSSPAARDGSERRICQDCHMPQVRRRIESYNPQRPYSAALVLLGEKVDGRRHRFALPREPWEDIELELLPGARTRVRVTNRVPHAIPTGSFGQRVARLRVSWPGGEAEQLLHASLKQSIAAGETRVFEFTSVPRGAAVHGVLERRNPRSGRFEQIAPEPELATDPEPRP